MMNILKILNTQSEKLKERGLFFDRKKDQTQLCGSFVVKFYNELKTPNSDCYIKHKLYLLCLCACVGGILGNIPLAEGS